MAHRTFAVRSGSRDERAEVVAVRTVSSGTARSTRRRTQGRVPQLARARLARPGRGAGARSTVAHAGRAGRGAAPGRPGS